ncbi:UNVERIFIED_CONTAM: hypothetical protein K2H54_016785 [Gekko kuhli]
MHDPGVLSLHLVAPPPISVPFPGQEEAGLLCLSHSGVPLPGEREAPCSSSRCRTAFLQAEARPRLHRMNLEPFPVRCVSWCLSCGLSWAACPACLLVLREPAGTSAFPRRGLSSVRCHPGLTGSHLICPGT